MAQSVYLGREIAGQLDNGSASALASTAGGHLEVSVQGPRLPFGSVHTERLSPVFQDDGVYGISTDSMVTTTGLAVGTGSGSGTVTSIGNKLVVSTGTDAYAFASLQSRRRLRYRPGQGMVGRCTGVFSTPAALAVQVVGFGTSETTLAYGYNGTSFGILYSTGGVREIHTFTVTTPSTATNDYVMTLPNTKAVSVTATNNNSTTQTAYEIAQGTFPGWSASAVGATVVFLSASAGPKTGSFVLTQPSAGAPAAGTDAETLAGVASTDTWITKADWNGDTLDGSGSTRNPSGVLLDPTKGNVYQIGLQYLGFGPLEFDVEVVTSGNNNPKFVRVHTIQFPNTSTVVSMSQPSMPFLMAASSAGGTTNVSVSAGSFAGFIEGEVLNLGPRVSYDRDSLVTSSTTVFTPLFTVRNNTVYKGRANQTVIRLVDIAGSMKGNANAQCKFYVVRNPVLTGPVNFTAIGANSAALWDVAATGMTTPTQADRVWSLPLSETGMFSESFHDNEITLQPGESISVCIKGLAATSDCIATLNTREDH